MYEYEETRPQWAGRQIDESVFCQEFLLLHPMICYNGRFYTHKGIVKDEAPLRKEIYDTIKPYYSAGLQKRVDSILGALRLECQRDDFAVGDAVIHLQNGTYHVINGFTEDFYVCRHRLPVSYDPFRYSPKLWTEFLEQLLEPEDILTLQEYMGYCLIPTNRAQKMLIITGEGGEGKSRIGVVMKALLGENMHQGSIAKIEHNQFARADLENVLLMVDDDLRLEALNSTNYLKSIITAELPQDLERKGKQSYQGMLYARFMAFGNGTLQSLHDRSYGFYRRQIILTAKPRDPNRVDDPFLGDRLKEEADSILFWALEGLSRLIQNDYRFTISKKAQENWLNAVAENNNIPEFLRSDGYIRFDSQGCVSSRLLYEIYKDWCEDNAMRPLANKTFWSYLSANCQKYQLRYSQNVDIGNGRKVRGFRGIRALSRY